MASPCAADSVRVYARTSHSLILDRLAHRQLGVVHRRQLLHVGFGPHLVDANLQAERWLAMGEEVVLLQNVPPDRRQSMWVAVLDAGVCALGSHTSLELAGFRSFASEAETIHLIVPRGDKVTRFDGVQVHESRRLHPEQTVFTEGLPRTPTARAVLDAAAWQPYPRFAATMVAAAVQALGELDLVRMCRQFCLLLPDRQVPRRDASGVWRYLDAEWHLPGGVVVLEVDGKHHMDADLWQADMRRERSIVIGRTFVLRATNFEVRHEPAYLVRDLRALGVPLTSELSESRAPLTE